MTVLDIYKVAFMYQMVTLIVDDTEEVYKGYADEIPADYLDYNIDQLNCDSDMLILYIY